MLIDAREYIDRLQIEGTFVGARCLCPLPRSSGDVRIVGPRSGR
jgi:hypothetical protein